MPKVSVVMPTYNSGKYLREAVNSIFAQTYIDFELIVVDDYSNDDTRDILQSYNDKRLRVINGPCCGLSAALNLGIDLAQGQYVARMDADDISLPYRFARQVEFLDCNPEFGLCGTLAMAFYPDRSRPEHLWGDGYQNNIECPGIIHQLIITNVCHPTVMFRKEEFNYYRLRYNESYKAAEDQELWARALRYIRFYNIQEVHLRYRAHADNASCTRKVEGENNLKQVHIDLLTWLYPTGNYERAGLEEQISELKCVLERQTNQPRMLQLDENDMVIHLGCENRIKRVIAMFLFDREKFKEKIRARLHR